MNVLERERQTGLSRVIAIGDSMLLAACQLEASGPPPSAFTTFLLTWPMLSSRIRAASLGCTWNTFSPTPISCWASR